jgi:hypothetical protein
LKHSQLFVVLALGLLVLALPARAQLSGAIYTSFPDGTTVNGNIYPSKDDVYLNGGPQNQNAAGLPDGPYYFQVTDPSGKVLLSEDDAVCRQLMVSGGRVAGPIVNGCSHPAGSYDPGSGSTPVKLMPFADTPNNGGEYKAWLIRQGPNTTIDSGDPKVIYFLQRDVKTDNFKVRESGGGGEPEPVAIVGNKFYDTNTNGTWDQPTEPPIPGWRIERNPPEVPDLVNGGVTFTSTNGQYSFLVDPNSGLYTITEVPPPPGFYPAGDWLNTTPTSGQVEVAEDDVAGPDFGNVCLGEGGGRTLGFWSNKNGERVMGSTAGGMSATLAYLSGLNLRNANGSDFNPSSYAQFRTWLLSATATNMAYMLSAQLAAMALNVRQGLVDGNSLIYAPGSSSANGAGFATVNALLAEANTELGLHGLTLAGSPYRAYQEALKNALDKGNNNLIFVQPGPCAFDTPY